MADDQKVLQQALSRALSGKDSHVENANILAGLSWELAGARPDGVPHTLFELLNHMIYWQEWVVKWLDGKKPRPPKHAAGGWPGKPGPANQREWQRTVQRFRKALGALNRRSRQGDPLSKTRRNDAVSRCSTSSGRIRATTPGR